MPETTTGRSVESIKTRRCAGLISSRVTIYGTDKIQVMDMGGTVLRFEPRVVPSRLVMVRVF